MIRGLEALDADEHDEEGGAGGHVPDREAIRCVTPRCIRGLMHLFP